MSTGRETTGHEIEGRPITMKHLVITAIIFAAVTGPVTVFISTYVSLSTRLTVVEERTSGIREQLTDINTKLQKLTDKP